MAVNLNDSEYLADNILNRISQLINERNILRSELLRQSGGSTEQNKAFVKAYQDNVFTTNAASIKTAKLEHLLMLR